MDPQGLDGAKLAQLLTVARGLVTERDPDSVLNTVIKVACELTGARYAAVGILDADKRQLARFLTYGLDDDARRRIGLLPTGHGILGELIRDPRPLRLARLSDHPRSYGFPAEHPQMNTFLGAPVRIGGEVFGNLYLTEKEGGEEFDQTDEDLLVLLADFAAVAVDNARTHEQSRRGRRRIETALRGLEETAALNREMVGRGDFDRVVELVVKRARSLADSRTALLVLVEGEELRVAATAGDVDPAVLGRVTPQAGSISFGVLSAGRGQLMNADVAVRFSEVNPGGGSGIIVPLQARGSDVGVLAIFERLDPDHPFTSDDVLALESFGTSAATRIYAARALEDEKVNLSIASSERERQRWARELHDETLQELGALNVMQTASLNSDDPESLRQALIRSNAQVEQIIAGLHSLITELRPASLDQLGVGAAVGTLAERMHNRSGLDVELDVDLDFESGRAPERLEPDLEATIYRLVQEALTNVVKHANATRARVKIEETGGAVAITVEDDGAGLQGTPNGGFGLVGMRERVGLRGGDLKISSSPDAGTRVDAVLPAVHSGLTT
jgi:signal transduction histidine kinase